MFKKYLPLFIIFLFLISFVFPKNLSAATAVSIIDYPPIISEGENFNISVSISDATDGTNYLRADLFKEGTTNYFGETFNGSIWYGGSTGQNYLPVVITSGLGSGMLQARIGTPSTSEYTGPGNYKLKVRRYYGQTGSSYIFSNTVDIQIVSESPTVTPSATPNTTLSPTSTPTIEPTKSPSPTPTASPTVSTAVPTTTPTIIPSVTATPIVTTNPTQTPIATVSPKPHNEHNKHHEFRLPFKFKCEYESHDFKFKKVNFRYYSFHFRRD